MKTGVKIILGLAIASALIFVPANGLTQTSKTAKLIQAPVPPNTAPVASKDQPYVYRKRNDKLDRHDHQRAPVGTLSPKRH
jgi:hypothetical protein